METLLIKIGGGKSINWDFLCRDLQDLSRWFRFILVHGASAKRNEIAEQLGAPTRLVKSPSGIVSAYTDERALEIFLMVYAGLVNKQIVARLQNYGLNAIGLSGVDGRLWVGRRKPDLLVKENGKTKLLTGNRTGKVELINTGLIHLLLKNGYTPVICPPAITNDNEIINADNDRATAVMAKALGMKKVIVLFEAPGLLENPDDESTLIRQVSKDQLDGCRRFARGQMTKKLLGAREAFEAGVEKIFWGDARIAAPVTSALAGMGTVLG